MKDMTSAVFSSRLGLLEHIEGPLVACIIFYFRNKALHVLTVDFKNHLDPALPKHFLPIVCEGKKYFDKLNAAYSSSYLQSSVSPC